MKGLKIITGIISVLVVMPIWYYLLYKILIAIGASELMWFLFWIYLPLGILTQILVKITNSDN